MIVAIFATGVWLALATLERCLHYHRKCKAEKAVRDRHGCLPAPRLQNQRPFGIDRIEQLIRANAESRMMETLSFHFRQTGNTLEHVLLGSSGFATIEPGNIAALLTQDKSPTRNPSLPDLRADANLPLDFGIEARRNILQPIFGDGIFTQEGPDWQCSRRMIRNQLEHKRYNSVDLFEGTVNRLIQVIRQNDSDVVDLQPLFFRMTLDITTDFLFAQSVGSLTAPIGSKRQLFADAFDVVQTRAIQRMRGYDIRWLAGWLADWQCYSRAWNDLRHITDEMLDRTLETERDSCKSAPQRGILLAISQHVQGKTALRGQALNLLPAGRDTTASLLSWTLFLLVRHPQVMENLRAEIVSACEAEPMWCRNKLRGMRYLQNILKETLRLYPPVPINFRTASRDTVLPLGGGPDRLSPIVVPRGHSVAFCSYALHRRPDLYGMDAGAFRPERWEEDMPLLSDPTNARWGYIPFGAGPRSCLGMDVALTEAAYTIVRLVQEFPILKLPKDEPIELIGVEKQLATLVLSISKGCRVATA